MGKNVFQKLQEYFSANTTVDDRNPVVWTGATVRVRDGQTLLHSEEMKNDIKAVQELKSRGLFQN